MISENPIMRLAIFLSVLLLMFIVESYWPARSWLESRGKRISFSVGLATVNNIFMKLFIATPFILWTKWVSENGYGLSKVLGINGLSEILLTVLFFDFFDAIKHLWFHRIPFMWRFHRVHHTDKHLDILTALRYHPGEMVISAIIKAGWVLLWGPSVIAFMIFEILLNLSSQFHHANITLGEWDGILNKIFVTPKYHAIHHTINRAKGDQNFTTIFSFWDRLLGSYVCPQTTDINLERLGTLQDKHLNLWTILKSPFLTPVSAKGYLGENLNNQNDLLIKKFNDASVFQKNNKAIIIDVREEDEIKKTGKVQSAIIRPYSQLKSNPSSYLNYIQDNYDNKKLFIYCAAGIRSEKVCTHLRKLNLDAVNLGGYSDCLEHGLVN